MNVWMNARGEYLQICYIETHVGRRVEKGFTRNIDEATVQSFIQDRDLRDYAEKNLIKLPARVERRVYLEGVCL